MISSWHKQKVKVIRTTTGSRVCNHTLDVQKEARKMKKENPYIYNRQIADALGVGEHFITEALRGVK
jgi:hypothetical protein